MNFLFIASFPDSIINFRGALIDDLIARGLKVSVAAPKMEKNSKVYKELCKKGVNIYEIPLHRKSMNPFMDIYLLLILIRLIKKIRPKYVLSYTIKPVIYGSIASRYAGVPNVYCLITGLGNIFIKQNNIKYRLLKSIAINMYSIALSKVNKVFFQNSDDQALFGKLGVISTYSNSIVVNGSGVDTLSSLPTAFPEKITFLLIARLLKSKGINEYANAASIIKKKYPYVKFQLVGWLDGNSDSISKHELNGWIRSGTIEYLGVIEDIKTVISNCSVYVLPSFYGEGTPRTVLEAMSMGRPIITSDVPGCRQTTISGENGLLVPPKSVDKLVEAMSFFITNPESILMMGIASRRVAEKKYDVRKVNAIMLKEMDLN